VEGADDAVVRFTVNTSSLIASKGLFATVKACSNKLNKAINSGYTISKNLKKLNKHNQPLEASKDSFLKDDLKVIRKELKKHGVDFACLPCNEDKKKYQLFFKAKDHETINYGLDTSFKRILARQNKRLKQELKQEQAQKLKLSKPKIKKINPLKKSKSRGMPNLS